VPAGQTTLLEVDTGRVLRWENGENVQNPRFSPDSRWLVYNQEWLPGENDLSNSRIYRLDLAAPELRPQLIGVGFNPSISSRGDIAFNRQIDEQRAYVFVASLDGSVRRLSGIGATFTPPSWSPDGRWLVYASGYVGEGVDMPVTLLDATTWTERTVDYISNCQCDAGYSARWSPDSQLFASSRGPRVISATSGTVVPVSNVSAWIRENAVRVEELLGRILRQVVTVAATPQNRQRTMDVILQNPSDGSETLLLTGVVGSCLRWSPDSRWLVADDFCDTN
jgi:Tol biopolymer transport system component